MGEKLTSGLHLELLLLPLAGEGRMRRSGKAGRTLFDLMMLIAGIAECRLSDAHDTSARPRRRITTSPSQIQVETSHYATQSHDGQ